MKSFCLYPVVLALMLLCSFAAQAEEYTLYVRNSPFSGPFTVQGHKTYAPLDKLLLALRFSWRQEGLILYVYDISGGGTEIREKGPLQISFKGRLTSLELLDREGRSWAEVSALADSLNLVYLVSDALKTVDLLVPVSAGSLSAAAEAESAASEPKSGADKKAEQKADKGKPRRLLSSYYWTPSGILPGELQLSPVSLEDCDFYHDNGSFNASPRLYLNSLTLKNNGGRAAGVKVKINIITDGDSVFEAECSLASLSAGSSAKAEPSPSVWNNTAGRAFKVQLKIISE